MKLPTAKWLLGFLEGDKFYAPTVLHAACDLSHAFSYIVTVSCKIRRLRLCFFFIFVTKKWNFVFAELK